MTEMIQMSRLQLKDVVLNQVIVVGPYPSPGFFKVLKEEFKPATTVVVADDGWPQNRLVQIKKVMQRSKVEFVRVRSDNGSGLVHAKMYLFVWRNRTNGESWHRLVLGSANASIQGFGVHAETLVLFNLEDFSKSIQKGIIEYFSKLSSGADVRERHFRTRPATLIFPHIRVSRKEGFSSFDAWLRSGRLCHKYDPDSSFGKLQVKLKSKMPVTPVETIFRQSGFAKDTSRDELRKDYLDLGVSKVEDSPRWKGRYFLETDYGHWTSADCFSTAEAGELYDDKERNIEFNGTDAARRRAAIDKILSSKSSDHDHWVQEFMDSLKSVGEALQDQVKLDKYFVLSEGDIAWKHYRAKALEKIARDKARARDDQFVHRFVSGFSFPYVPPLGSDYEVFVEVFSGNLLRQAKSRNTKSWLAITLRDLVSEEGDLGSLSCGKDLVQLLRDKWDYFGKYLPQFYKTE